MPGVDYCCDRLDHVFVCKNIDFCTLGYEKSRMFALLDLLDWGMWTDLLTPGKSNHPESVDITILVRSPLRGRVEHPPLSQSRSLLTLFRISSSRDCGKVK